MKFQHCIPFLLAAGLLAGFWPSQTQAQTQAAQQIVKWHVMPTVQDAEYEATLQLSIAYYNNELNNVKVELVPSGKLGRLYKPYTATTNEEGKVEFENLPPGEYNIRIPDRTAGDPVTQPIRLEQGTNYRAVMVLKGNFFYEPGNSLIEPSLHGNPRVFSHEEIVHSPGR